MRIVDMMKIMTFIFLMCHSHFLFAQPEPVYGDTYEVPINPPDGMTASQYDQALRLQDQISATYPKLKVTYSGGVVRFEGDADSANQIIQIVESTESQPGVTDVDVTAVKISANGLMDQVITAKVNGTFVREKLFGGLGSAAFPVKVNTTNGVVTLTGEVDSQNIVDKAVQLASHVVGVKNVVSDIKIQQVLH